MPGRTLIVTARHGAFEPWWHVYDDADRERAAEATEGVEVVIHFPLFASPAASSRQAASCAPVQARRLPLVHRLRPRSPLKRRSTDMRLSRFFNNLAFIDPPDNFTCPPATFGPPCDFPGKFDVERREVESLLRSPGTVNGSASADPSVCEWRLSGDLVGKPAADRRRCLLPAPAGVGRDRSDQVARRPLRHVRPVVLRLAHRAGAGQVALRGLPAARRMPGRGGGASGAVGRLGRRDLRARFGDRAQATAGPSPQGRRRVRPRATETELSIRTKELP